MTVGGTGACTSTATGSEVALPSTGSIAVTVTAIEVAVSGMSHRPWTSMSSALSVASRTPAGPLSVRRHGATGVYADGSVGPGSAASIGLEPTVEPSRSASSTTDDGGPG